jgi:hypothetical protein
MGVRIEAMQNSAHTERPGRNRMLLRRLAFVFLVGLIAGVILSFVGLANRTIQPAAFVWASAAGLGLLSGFAARWALRDHTALLRALTSIAAVMVSLLFVGWISGGDLGLVLYRPERSLADWNGLLQVTIAAGSAALALAAWARGRLPASPATMPPASDSAGPTRPALPASPPPIPIEQGIIRRLQTTLDRTVDPIRRGLRRRMRAWKNAWRDSGIAGRLASLHPSAARFRRQMTTHHSRVRLLGVEEHRCPYCLDIVEPHDPRGVVICKVCHTRHHADCWAVTGMCQVPHHHR